MKEDPSLNVNHDTAIYGLTSDIPDRALLRDFVCMHIQALLDILNWLLFPLINIFWLLMKTEEEKETKKLKEDEEEDFELV